MLSELSETWAAAFFQVFVTLWLFLLGVFFLAYQVQLPAELRRLAFRRTRMIYGFTSALVGVVLILIFFVMIDAYTFLEEKGLESSATSRVVVVAATVVFLAPLGLWWFLSRYQPRSLLRRTVVEAERGLGENGKFPDGAIRDFSLLVSLSQGRLRPSVLFSAAGRLTAFAQSDYRYSGKSLATVIEALQLLPMSSDGGPRAFSEALSVTRVVLEGAVDRGFIDSEDSREALLYLRYLTLSATEVDDQESLARLLGFQQGLGTRTPELAGPIGSNLLDIGGRCLSEGLFVAAVITLSALESLVAATGGAASPAALSLAGLLGHFCGASSKAAQRRARTSIELYDNYGWEELARRAENESYYAGDFVTADRASSLVSRVPRLQAPRHEKNQE